MCKCCEKNPANVKNSMNVCNDCAREIAEGYAEMDAAMEVDANDDWMADNAEQIWNEWHGGY